MPPDLPPSLAPLAFLIGSWRGEGEGGYPGLEPFRYTEELSFEHVGDPFRLEPGVARTFHVRATLARA